MHIIYGTPADDVTGSNLLVDRWLPARSRDATESIGLHELFLCAHELTDIDSPITPAASGLWRILTVIAARVTGLDDMTLGADAWHDRRADILTAEGRFDPQRVSAYFDRYRERFDLFHPEQPFLQDPRLAEQCGKNSGINKLVLTRPSGQNQIWFDHHHDLDTRSLSANEAVWYLLAQLYYGPSGRCTSRTVSGVTEANSTAGPLRSAISFHPLGRTLFESLVTGIPYLEKVPHGDDLAPWERDTPHDPLGAPPFPAGVGGVLAGSFRHSVLLRHVGKRVEDAWITWAWRKPTPEVKDPYLVYQLSKTGNIYARGASTSRAIWRDVDALLLHDVGDRHSHRPAVLDSAISLPMDVLDALRVRAFGFDQDGQTRDRQWFTATTPRILSMLQDDDVANGVSRTRATAERAERHLRTALRNVWVAINDPSNGIGLPSRKDVPAGPWPERGSVRYWPHAERVFWRRVNERDFADSGSEFVRLAVDAYDEVTGSAGSAPRLIKAVERNRGYVYAARKEIS